MAFMYSAKEVDELKAEIEQLKAERSAAAVSPAVEKAMKRFHEVIEKRATTAADAEIEWLKAELKRRSTGEKSWERVAGIMKRGKQRMEAENAKLREAIERIKTIASKAELVSYGSWLICEIIESALRGEETSEQQPTTERQGNATQIICEGNPATATQDQRWMEKAKAIVFQAVPENGVINTQLAESFAKTIHWFMNGLEYAWTIIANSKDWDSRPDWKEAAERYRDEYWHRALDMKPWEQREKKTTGKLPSLCPICQAEYVFGEALMVSYKCGTQKIGDEVRQSQQCKDNALGMLVTNAEKQRMAEILSKRENAAAGDAGVPVLPGAEQSAMTNHPAESQDAPAAAAVQGRPRDKCEPKYEHPDWPKDCWCTGNDEDFSTFQQDDGKIDFWRNGCTAVAWLSIEDSKLGMGVDDREWLAAAANAKE
jgi:hypothetical protein